MLTPPNLMVDSVFPHQRGNSQGISPCLDKHMANACQCHVSQQLLPAEHQLQHNPEPRGTFANSDCSDCYLKAVVNKRALQTLDVRLVIFIFPRNAWMFTHNFRPLTLKILEQQRLHAG